MTKTDAGATVPVLHACGHDVHMPQPAEETGECAAAMVDFTPGYTMASSDPVDITIYGRGGERGAAAGHGGSHRDRGPHRLALQTIVAREIKPRDPAVATVGVFNGRYEEQHHLGRGAARASRFRSYKPEVRKHMLASIEPTFLQNEPNNLFVFSASPSRPGQIWIPKSDAAEA